MLGRLRVASQAGIGWMHLTVFWAIVQPTPGAFEWRIYDRVILKVREQGLQIVAQLSYATEWNTTAPEGPRGFRRHHHPPKDYDAWRRYVSETVSRYRRHVQHWEVWNEPDLRGFGGGTPAEYARLLAVAHDAIKQADPAAKVLLAGLSLGGTPGMLDVNFLTKILSDPPHPAAKHFDIANFHHYGSKAEARRRMEYVRTELARVCAADRPIWITEAGASSDPAHGEGQYRGPEGQARWLRELIPYLIELGAAKVFWFQLMDNPKVGLKFAATGLLDGEANAKPVYDAYRELISQSGR